MARRNMKNAVEKCGSLMSSEFERMIHGFAIPTGRDSRREESFYLRSEVDPTLVEGIEQGLDAKAVAGGEDCPVYTVPKHEREFSPQSVQAISAKLLIKMKDNFAV